MPSYIQTVTGPITPEEAMPILPHEHVMVDFGGADITGPHRWDRADVIAVVTPHLKRLAARGWKTLVECTPKWLGRDVELLRELTKTSGLHIITNTGLYKNQYLPERVGRMTAEKIADEWILETSEGIDGQTWARPGFIKTAVDKGPLTELQRTLIRAAAITSGHTGLPIATHTEDVRAAKEILAIVQQSGVDPVKWIYVHAHLEESVDALLRIAESGCWIELDGIGWGEDRAIRQKLLSLIEAGFESRVLLSHDAGWYHVGEPGGGEFRPYTVLADEFLPSLEAAGISKAARDRIILENPIRAFALSKS